MWHDDGTVERIHDALRGQNREADGRDAEPSAGLIDSRSVRNADTVPAATRRFDAGTEVKDRKRFIVTETPGLLLTVHVVAASVQDRDGARRPLLWTRLGHPGIKKIWADQGFAGRLVNWTITVLDRQLEIVHKDSDFPASPWQSADVPVKTRLRGHQCGGPDTLRRPAGNRRTAAACVAARRQGRASRRGKVVVEQDQRWQAAPVGRHPVEAPLVA
ncbi:transposase [Streptomyces sp. CA-249302]|uniref:transposase n=1 Tax=Streptomyces sp. CA-249302 TaxID=3240058 RepID=UPI003D8A1337